MTDLKPVTPSFSVAGRLTPADFAEIAAAGFKTVINNRPDGEEPGQMTDAQAKAAAEAAGLKYVSIPFAGQLQPNTIVHTELTLDEVEGPVLGFCRTGTRSITAWAAAQVRAGRYSADEVMGLAAKAGYDLSAYGTLIGRLAPS